MEIVIWLCPLAAIICLFIRAKSKDWDKVGCYALTFVCVAAAFSKPLEVEAREFAGFLAVAFIGLRMQLAMIEQKREENEALTKELQVEREAEA